MINLKIVKKNFVEKLSERVNNEEAFNEYLAGEFNITENELISSPWNLNSLEFKTPDSEGTYEFENAVTLFEALNGLDRTTASDPRLWVWLTHVHFWNYMNKRRNINKAFAKIEKENTDSIGRLTKKKDYIYEHYLIDSPSTVNLLRSGISGLWWGVYITYDTTRGKGKEYDLTKEYFSMLDYSRTLAGRAMRCNNVAKGILEFVVSNDKVFSKNKEAKVRWMLRYINRIGGVKPLSTLSKKHILDILESQKTKIEKVID